MNDGEFDQLLQKAGTTTEVRAATLARLVEHTATRRNGGRSRRPVGLGVAVAGAVLLAAAASSTYWTKLAPFQSVENGMYRAQTAIPVDFTTTSDLQVRCEAFLEFKGLSVPQSQQVEAYITRHDWSGLGQRLYDQHPPAHESYEHAQDRIYSALDPVLEQAATAAVPGVHPKGTDTDAAQASGWSINCQRVAK